MNETLEQLIKLQGIDHRLLEIMDIMGDLPSKVEVQEEEVTSLELDNKGKRKRISEIEKEMRHYEREIDGMNTKMAKYKDQLYLVKSNKEYDSLNHEIDHMKTAISKAETQFLNLTEEKESLDETIKLNTTKITSITELLDSNKVELKLAMAKTNSEQEELEQSRRKLFKDIESVKLLAYERVRERRKGAGMVHSTTAPDSY